MKNTSLKTDLPRIIEDKSNISSIHKGGVSGSSLEITYIEPYAHASYLYNNPNHRDEDLGNLTLLIK
jgi:hypothetical protein